MGGPVMPTAYEGRKPYIFVSYAHKDKADVMRYIDALEKRGFLVWFDGGVEAGSEWPEYIANRLADSACVLAFISPNFVKSQNCRRELVLTQELEKEQLNVYIRKVELSMGMRMQLGLNQALWRENFATEAEFLDELCRARVIRCCKEVSGTETVSDGDGSGWRPSGLIVPGTVEQRPSEYRTEQAVKDTDRTPSGPQRPEVAGPVEQKLRGCCKRLGWAASILELLYIPVSWQLMEYMTSFDIGAWWLFVNMIFPHTIIAVINKIQFRRLRKAMNEVQMNKESLTNAAVVTVLCLLLSTVVSVIGGASHLAIRDPFILRLLYSLGLNAVPFFIAGIMTVIEAAD